MPFLTSPSRHQKLESAARSKLVAEKRRIPLATKNNGAEPFSPFRMTLPRTLPGPASTDEVDVDGLVDAYPDLAGVPVEYVRDNLPRKSMRAAVQAIKVSLPDGSLPRESQILLSDAVAADCPTHIFAVHHASPTVGQKRRVALFPAHDLLFRAHCARLQLPAISPSHSTTSTSTSSTISDPHQKTLPVLPLCLPSPETFPILHAYLYTRHAAALLAALAPPCDSEEVSDLLRLAQHARKVHGFWSNARALGIVDARMYEVIEACWERTVFAMRACS